MARTHLDSRRRGGFAAFAAAMAMLHIAASHAAGDRREPIVLRQGESTNLNMSANFTTGILSMENLDLVQGKTVLTAKKAEATGLVDGKFDNATWKLTGQVHVEAEGAVLDAQSATVVFVSGIIHSVRVEPSSGNESTGKSPVHLEFEGAVLDAQTSTVSFVDGRLDVVSATGSPAQFSHQLKNSARRVHGRANNIDYDSAKKLMRISGDSWFSDGSNDFQTQQLFYNLGDGSFQAKSSSSGTIRPDERVTTPRTPDRATAK